MFVFLYRIWNEPIIYPDIDVAFHRVLGSALVRFCTHINYCICDSVAYEVLVVK
jgi:hypothetical protein